MMAGWGMYGGGGWIALILLFILVAGAVAAFVVTTGRNHAPHDAAPHRLEETGREADRILERRFATGEIDEDEYLRRRSLLHDRF